MEFVTIWGGQTRYTLWNYERTERVFGFRCLPCREYCGISPHDVFPGQG